MQFNIRPKGWLYICLTVDVEGTEHDHNHQANWEDGLVESFTQEANILYWSHNVVHCRILGSGEFHEVVTDRYRQPHDEAAGEEQARRIGLMVLMEGVNSRDLQSEEAKISSCHYVRQEHYANNL